MKNGMGSRAQSAGGVNQSRSSLHGGIASRGISLLRRVWMHYLPPIFTLLAPSRAHLAPHVLSIVCVFKWSLISLVFFGSSTMLCQASSIEVAPTLWWSGSGNSGPGPYGTTAEPGPACVSCLAYGGGFQWTGVFTVVHKPPQSPLGF